MNPKASATPPQSERSSSSAVSAKRAAQNRQAQRNFRNKKDARIKELENLIASLESVQKLTNASSTNSLGFINNSNMTLVTRSNSRTVVPGCLASRVVDLRKKVAALESRNSELKMMLESFSVSGDITSTPETGKSPIQSPGPKYLYKSVALASGNDLVEFNQNIYHVAFLILNELKNIQFLEGCELVLQVLELLEQSKTCSEFDEKAKKICRILLLRNKMIEICEPSQQFAILEIVDIFERFLQATQQLWHKFLSASDRTDSKSQDSVISDTRSKNFDQLGVINSKNTNNLIFGYEYIRKKLTNISSLQSSCNLIDDMENLFTQLITEESKSTARFYKLMTARGKLLDLCSEEDKSAVVMIFEEARKLNEESTNQLLSRMTF